MWAVHFGFPYQITSNALLYHRDLYSVFTKPFDSRHTGKGYAREAVSKLVEYAFHKLNAKRIAIDVSVHNEKSLKLPKSLNFQSEGIMKNHYRNFLTNKIADAERFVITDIKQLNNSHRWENL